jgi:hypothetical protein
VQVSTPNPRHLTNIIRHYLLGKPWPKKLSETNTYHIKEFYLAEFVELLHKQGFEPTKIFGQTVSFGKISRMLSGFDLISKLLVLTGYFFPSLSMTVVVEARKKKT